MIKKKAIEGELVDYKIIFNYEIKNLIRLFSLRDVHLGDKTIEKFKEVIAIKIKIVIRVKKVVRLG